MTKSNRTRTMTERRAATISDEMGMPWTEHPADWAETHGHWPTEAEWREYLLDELVGAYTLERLAHDENDKRNIRARYEEHERREMERDNQPRKTRADYERESLCEDC